MTKIKCLKCGDIIESDGHGKWVQCSCKNCYIDETSNYCRVGGNFDTYEIYDDNKWVMFDKYLKELNNNVEKEETK